MIFTRSRFFVFVILSFLFMQLSGQDKNFYIFLCFGQSNMEGAAKIESQDSVGVDPRFQMLATVNCDFRNRIKGNWYPAIPPLCRCRTGLSPSDYFGRTLVANLPAKVRVGVINVSIGGCKIELFDRENYQSYVTTAPDWLKNMVKDYDGNPYGRLVEMAKFAQQSGVIKGILLHQGESNTNDSIWPVKVKGVYDNLMHDLNLNPKKVPLIAGELLSKEQGGKCASMNRIIQTLPQVIPNSYVISSEGCTGAPDGLHFTSEGYRLLGERYGLEMLSILGIKSNTK